MSPENIRNDIKTLFLILNSLNALATGLFPLSAGIYMGLQNQEPIQALSGMAIGLPVLGTAALGCFGAIRDNKNYLVTYSVLNGLLSALATVLVTAHIAYTSHPKMNLLLINVAAFYICTALAATVLAVLLAKRARPDSSSSVQRTWLWRSVGLTVAFIVVIYCMSFFA